MKGNKVISVVRVMFWVVLLVSLVVAMGLLLNYVENLSPDNDGFAMGNWIAEWIHGDIGWSWSMLRQGLTGAWSAVLALVLAYGAFEGLCRVRRQRVEKSL